jgi:3-oxoacid CoA-transferase subunit A
VSIGDTIGKATPDEVKRLFELLLRRFPSVRLAAHFHDTFGQAIDNAIAAYGLGIRIFDTSAGGIGGCPFAPGAPGNLSTEVLLEAFPGQAGVDANLVKRAAALLDPVLAARHYPRICRSGYLAPPVNKVFESAREACADIPDGATLFVGGFGLAGVPVDCIMALRDLGSRQLTVVSNNAGTTDHGLVHLLKNRQIRKMISSYVGENQVFEQQMLSGQIEVELTPQGTLSERIRAGGAGIPAFFTATGVGTKVAEGKEVREFEGRRYVMERAITGDFALIHAWKGDRFGNLVYRKTARNFSPMMAMAGRITIAEVEHLVEPGELEPDLIHTPAIFVQRIFQAAPATKLIERRTVRKRP